MSGKTRIDHYDNNNIRERGRCVATQTNTRRHAAAVTMFFSNDHGLRRNVHQGTNDIT